MQHAHIVRSTLTGLAVSIGTLTFGPILLFGLLVLPPLTARSWSRSMGGFLALSSVLGLSAAALGLVLSKEMDLPMGPAVVVAASLELGAGVVFRPLGRAK